MVLDNRIENIRNDSGGSGQFGNGVNASPRRPRHRARQPHPRLRLLGRARQFRLRISRSPAIPAATSARSRSIPSSASRARSSPTTRSTAREIGVSVANFNEGGRIAVVQGNIFRNLAPRPARTSPTARTASASMSRPTPRSPATWSRTRHSPASWPAGAAICATSRSPATWCAGAEIGVGVSVVPGAGGAVIAEQHDLRLAARRHPRHGPYRGRDRRPRQGRGRALRPARHHRQPGELTPAPRTDASTDAHNRAEMAARRLRTRAAGLYSRA